MKKRRALTRHSALGHLAQVTHSAHKELAHAGLPHTARAISAHGGAIASIASVIHPMHGPGKKTKRKGSRKRRTPKQIAATKKMLAANRRRTGGGKRSKRRGKGGSRKRRTPAQVRATKKLVAMNKRRRKGR